MVFTVTLLWSYDILGSRRDASSWKAVFSMPLRKCKFCACILSASIQESM